MLVKTFRTFISILAGGAPRLTRATMSSIAAVDAAASTFTLPSADVIEDRARGAYYGLLIADALSMPV